MLRATIRSDRYGNTQKRRTLHVPVEAFPTSALNRSHT